MSSYTYKTHHIPASDKTLLPFLAGKFAALRLSALSTAPLAFSSTFATESKFTFSQWIKRLERRGVYFFIAVAYPEDTLPEHQTIDAGDWVGTATILGPLSRANYELPESGGPLLPADDAEARWHMTSVYNSPLHRRKGIAKMLIEGAIDFAVQQTEKGKGVRMRIMVHPSNVVVKNLYYGLGFVDAGRGTLAEAYKSNGEADLIPPDGGASNPEKYLNRSAVIMERVTLSENQSNY